MQTLKATAWLRALPWTLLLGAACGGAVNTLPFSSGSASGGSSGASAGSHGAAGSGVTSGTTTPSGTGISGAPSSATTTSSAGAAGTNVDASGASGASSANGMSGSVASTSGAGASSGSGSGTVTSGSAGSGSSTGSGNGGSEAGVLPTPGCGLIPITDRSTGFTSHKIDVPACGDAGPVTSDCVAPPFLPGGAAYASSGAYDYNHRDFTVELPVGYDAATPYPVFFGAGGCGGVPPQTGAGFSVNETGAIKIGLSYVSECFADGGVSCSQGADPSICVNNPEVPYFRAVLAEVEAQFCVDRSRIFAGGYETGAFDALMLGCAEADVIRGTTTMGGGLHVHRPACSGPVAALMVDGEEDMVNPIGPLAVVNTGWDSFGLAPARDDILTRNGCVGTATALYDPRYPRCVKYTGCPAAYPVVWCPLPDAGHDMGESGGVNYFPGNVQGDPLMWGFLWNAPSVH